MSDDLDLSKFIALGLIARLTVDDGDVTPILFGEGERRGDLTPLARIWCGILAPGGVGGL